MFCTNCGNKLDEGDRFCTRCGTQIGGISPVYTVKESKKRKNPIAIVLAVILLGLLFFVGSVFFVMKFGGSELQEELYELLGLDDGVEYKWNEPYEINGVIKEGIAPPDEVGHTKPTDSYVPMSADVEGECINCNYDTEEDLDRAYEEYVEYLENLGAQKDKKYSSVYHIDGIRISVSMHKWSENDMYVLSANIQ